MLQDQLDETNFELLRVRHQAYNKDAKSLNGQLSKALKFISKLKNFEIKQNEKKRQKSEYDYNKYLEQLDCQVADDSDDQHDKKESAQYSVSKTCIRMDTASFGQISPKTRSSSVTFPNLQQQNADALNELEQFEKQELEKLSNKE